MSLMGIKTPVVRVLVIQNKERSVPSLQPGQDPSQTWCQLYVITCARDMRETCHRFLMFSRPEDWGALCHVDGTFGLCRSFRLSGCLIGSFPCKLASRVQPLRHHDNLVGTHSFCTSRGSTDYGHQCFLSPFLPSRWGHPGTRANGNTIGQCRRPGSWDCIPSG